MTKLLRPRFVLVPVLSYDIDAGPTQQEGKARNTFITLMREIDTLAQAMEIHFSVDIVETNLRILDNLSPQLLLPCRGI